jgi:hypothetical protein
VVHDTARSFHEAECGAGGDDPGEVGLCGGGVPCGGGARPGGIGQGVGRGRGGVGQGASEGLARSVRDAMKSGSLPAL